MSYDDTERAGRPARSVAFQAGATQQGRAYESQVAARLEGYGWTIVHRNWHEPRTGTEVDIVAIDPTGRRWWVECKGSQDSQSGRNGCRRSDTVKKAIADAWLLSTLPGRESYLLVTSDSPEPGSHPDVMLRAALDAGIITALRVIRF